MSPEYVRPYVKSQMNDDRNAEAIAEAALTHHLNRRLPARTLGEAEARKLTEPESKP
jgi:hypothetical protein